MCVVFPVWHTRCAVSSFSVVMCFTSSLLLIVNHQFSPHLVDLLRFREINEEWRGQVGNDIHSLRKGGNTVYIASLSDGECPRCVCLGKYCWLVDFWHLCSFKVLVQCKLVARVTVCRVRETCGMKVSTVYMVFVYHVFVCVYCMGGVCTGRALQLVRPDVCSSTLVYMYVLHSTMYDQLSMSYILAQRTPVSLPGSWPQTQAHTVHL